MRPVTAVAILFVSQAVLIAPPTSAPTKTPTTKRPLGFVQTSHREGIDGTGRGQDGRWEKQSGFTSSICTCGTERSAAQYSPRRPPGRKRRGVGSYVGILNVNHTGGVGVIKEFHCSVIDDVLIDVEELKNYYVLEGL